jgi:hypothetical protein
MKSWKLPKLRWLLLAWIAWLAGRALWHLLPQRQDQLASAQTQEPMPRLLLPAPYEGDEPAEPKKHGKHAHPKKRGSAEPVLVGMSGSSPVLSSPAEGRHLFEDLAFKTGPQVSLLLGEPDAKLKHDEEDGQAAVQSWYYLRQYQDATGKSVCPELRFIDGKVRFAVFWTPSAMRSLVADVGSNSSSAKGHAPQDFSFKDGFRYLEVGTPEDMLLGDLGEPDARRQDPSGAEAWDYNTLIVEDGAPKHITVFIKDGKVSEIRGRQ